MYVVLDQIMPLINSVTELPYNYLHFKYRKIIQLLNRLVLLITICNYQVLDQYIVSEKKYI